MANIYILIINDDYFEQVSKLNHDIWYIIVIATSEKHARDLAYEYCLNKYIDERDSGIIEYTKEYIDVMTNVFLSEENCTCVVDQEIKYYGVVEHINSWEKYNKKIYR